ncbi:hypothetical protein HWB92_gp039 [Serratia phage vB_SmaA_3M]|uniref:Uncharacterized protein n=1 Tax=Serratia phage vB_SmaA_3M TaxID=2419930 RepID=A0A3G2YS23_9CAUD|nr:hypothetical protein HWB92_gp039 [Serratia phage vB_SmaA_3M]AYP28297.1 hypothetical protein 3M_041 [Serratia phage vB_SmaA_3M]
MSIKITKEMAVSKSFPELYLEIQQGYEKVEVTYTVESIGSITNGQATINYSVGVAGEKSPAWRQWSFPYDGKSNPFEAAEEALREHLSDTQKAGE